MEGIRYTARLVRATLRAGPTYPHTAAGLFPSQACDWLALTGDPRRLPTKLHLIAIADPTHLVPAQGLDFLNATLNRKGRAMTC